MSGRFQLWVLPILVLGLGAFGLVDFFQQASKLTTKPTQSRAPVSISKAAKNKAKSDSLFRIALAADSVLPRSPFGQPTPPRVIARPSVVASPTIPRPVLVLKGTVGTQAATLINARGEKSILRVGESVDSVLVLRIEPGKVTLRDSHGVFEISAQE